MARDTSARGGTGRLPGRLLLVVLAALAGLAAVAGVGAQGGATANVEVRVWQHVEDGRNLYVNARAVGGAWAGLTALSLDDGVSPSGRFRFEDVTLDVPLADYGALAPIEVRVWQDVRDDRNIHVSVRPGGGSWRSEELPLDDGFDRSGAFHYGAITLDVPAPEGSVSTLYGTRREHVPLRYRGFEGIDIDSHGGVVVADFRGHAIRRISPQGVISTIAGGNGRGTDDGPASEARFDAPLDVAVADDGTIYVVEEHGRTVRKITPDGMVTTVAGNPSADPNEGVTDGRGDEVVFARIFGIELDSDGNLYIIEHFRVRRLTAEGVVETIAGGNSPGYRDGPGHFALFDTLRDVDVDDAGNVYVLEANTDAVPERAYAGFVRVIDPEGAVRTLPYTAPQDVPGGLAQPYGLAVADDGTVYLSSGGRRQLLGISPDGRLFAVAGTGEEGTEDGPRYEATFQRPRALALSGDGSLVVVDHYGELLRVIAPDPRGFAAVPLVLAELPPLYRVEGVEASVFTGDGGRTYSDGPPGVARFGITRGLALAPDGSVVISDVVTHAISRIAPDGTVTTLAGGSREGYRDGPGQDAWFNQPVGLAVAADGSIYVADSRNDRIRKIAPDGVVSTVAGNGEAGPLPQAEDAPALEVRINRPSGLAFDGDGSLYILTSTQILRLSPEGTVSRVSWGAENWRGLVSDGEGGLFYVERGTGDGFTLLKKHRNNTISTVFEGRSYYEGGRFSHTPDFTVAADGTIYVLNSTRVLRISADGEVGIVIDFETDFPQGVEPHNPHAIVIDAQGNLIVAASKIWKITLPDE